MAIRYPEELVMRRVVDFGLSAVRKVLGTERDPVAPADAHHAYADKFALADFLTNTALGAVGVGLEHTGAAPPALEAFVAAAGTRTITLAFKATETCKFDKHETREVKSRTSHVAEMKAALGTKSVETYTVTTVDDYFWDFGVEYCVYAYAGADPAAADSGRVVLSSGTRAAKIKTAHDKEPHPPVWHKDTCEVNVTKLFKWVAGGERAFRIDRASPQCRTPRRNDDVAAVLEALKGFGAWCRSLESYCRTASDKDPDASKRDMSSASALSRSAAAVFVPVVPLFAQAVKEGEAPAPPALLDGADAAALIAEGRRQLEAKLDEAAAAFPAASASAGITTQQEVRLCVTLRWLDAIAEAYMTGVEYIEGMLRDQLVAAIGKHVKSRDFEEYMIFHNRKLFAEAYAPKGFCHAVRRPMHNPEGLVSLERDGEPVQVLTRSIPEGEGCEWSFVLDAAATVRFTGTTSVHSFTAHRFSNEPLGALDFVARAKQFSAYVVLLGHIGGADVFLPKHAFLCQNKDEFKIPVDLDMIPSAKEFKDAIASLSPEQQRFAKAYRAMQLEATLFGVCVIQVKPQLEKVLNLPPDALMKEMKLTQDLLELFVEYQIASDLLSFQADTGAEGAELVGGVTGREKVAAVRCHVDEIFSMLDVIRKSEVELEKLKAERAKLERERAAMEEERAEMYAELERERAELERERARDREEEDECMFAEELGAYAQQMEHAMESHDVCMMRCAEPVEALSACAPMDYIESAPREMNMAGDDLLGLVDEYDVIEADAPAEDAAAEPHEEAAANEPPPAAAAAAQLDISSIPQELEGRYEALDEDNCVRPTLLKVQDAWRKVSQKNLLSKPQQTFLDADGTRKEKEKAFELLDALTRSGAVPIDGADLHVVIAATHCFDKSLLNTVVQDNVNPIEKMERSTLIAASTIHGCPPGALLNGAHVDRVAGQHPKLFLK